MANTFLEIHEELLRDGSTSGLWQTFVNGRLLGDDDIFDVMIPTYWELVKYHSSYFWDEGPYTPHLQNIILLCAAMNNEL